MSKKENNVVAKNELAVQEVQNENGIMVSTEELLRQMSEAEVGQELGSDYFTLEPGETERVIFMEMTKMNKMGTDNETIDAVRLLGSDGKFKICADKVLVSTCRQLQLNDRKNVALQIICKGKIKTPRGSYKDLQINELLVK
ncbi:MAG TPA: hypothetical protein PKD00_08995 [Burkholderiales bacterium]|nr:hypothetical protein [Burkholderiales bacterium]